MKQVLKSIACSKSSSASVVDGKLILSFPDASIPVVWQMDLTQTKASALEVHEDKTAGTFNLALKNPKGETVDIASFKKRDSAVDGLMAASKALENAHGQIRPVTANTNAVPGQPTMPRTRGKWIPAIFGLILLVVLFGIWSSMLPNASDNFVQSGLNPASAPSQQANTVGVPISAEDFLRNQ